MKENNTIEEQEHPSDDKMHTLANGNSTFHNNDIVFTAPTVQFAQTDQEKADGLLNFNISSVKELSVDNFETASATVSIN